MIDMGNHTEAVVSAAQALQQRSTEGAGIQVGLTFETNSRAYAARSSIICTSHRALPAPAASGSLSGFFADVHQVPLKILKQKSCLNLMLILGRS